MSRSKDKRGEREVAELLRSHGFPGRRGAQHRGGHAQRPWAGILGAEDFLALMRTIDAGIRGGAT